MKVIRIYRLCLLPIVFAAVAILVSACSDAEYNILEEGETVDVIFHPELSGVSTRAINDASKVDELIVLAVADGDAAPIITSMSWADAQNGVKVRLLQGRTYSLLFWAQHKDNGVYRIGTTIEADYSHVQSGFAGMENLDAFYAVRQNVAVGAATVGGQITLQRPFAQLNLANETSPNIVDKSYSATMTLTGLATVFDPFDGSVSGIGNDPYAFEYSDFPENDDPVKIAVDGEAKDYYFIAMAYLLPVENGVKVEYTLKEGETIVSECTGDKAITVLANTANTRYNLYGQMLVSEVMDDVYDGIFTMGTPLVDSYDAATGSYLVDECDDLIWMSDASNTAQLTRGNSFTLTKNLDFGADEGHTITPVILPDNAVINGNGKIIRNVTTSGGGLFGDAKGVTISDLTFESVTAASQSGTVTHVGTLFNSFEGEGILNAITVNNSVVTTSNGAAGGIVGYIGAGSQVKFDDCHVAETSVSGTVGEGHFVGLFRGYDNSETLTFGDNCTCTPSADRRQTVTKYREGNEATWLAGNDYTKFNDWLGDEEYYRGVVKYGEKLYIPKWDGETEIEPLKDGSTILIYSAFDLASLQGESPTTVVFKEDVDLGGDKADMNLFTPIASVKTLDGENHTVWNLNIYHKEWVVGFIQQTTATTVYKNIDFRNASVRAKMEGNELQCYVALLCPYAQHNYTVENITVSDSYVLGLGKLGIIGGYLTSEDGVQLNMTNVHVERCTLENIESSAEDEFAGGIVKFYPQGEAGGLIGMLHNDATITNCSVKNSLINCYGQDDKNVLIATIPGRHVNQFIGDIRTTSADVISIVDCQATGNEYGRRKDEFRYKSGGSMWKPTYSNCPFVGKAYNLPTGDTKGSVTVVNGATTTTIF